MTTTPAILTVFEHLRTGFMSEQGSFAKQSIDLAQRRISQLEELIKEASVEQGFWKRLLEHFSPCTRCGGTGRLVSIVAQDESHSEKCPVCKGSGVVGPRRRAYEQPAT